MDGRIPEPLEKPPPQPKPQNQTLTTNSSVMRKNCIPIDGRRQSISRGCWHSRNKKQTPIHFKNQREYKQHFPQWPLTEHLGGTLPQPEPDDKTRERTAAP
jgi:hypothetical protein